MNRIVLMSAEKTLVLRKENVPSWPMPWTRTMPPLFFYDGVAYLQTEAWDTTEDGKKWQIYLRAPELTA